MKKYVFLAFLLSLCLNIYGIWWAGPSDERIILVFSDHSMVDRLSPAMLQSRDDIYQGIEYYDQPQDYRDYDISIDGHNTQTVRRSLLDSARSYLLRSYAPDEHATLKAIGNMNPSRFDFNPGFFLYGGLYIYTVSIFLKLMSIAGVVKTIPDISYYFMNPGQMGLLFTYGKLISALFVSAAVFFVYLCGELLFGRRAGLIAAFLFAVTPAVVVWSHYLNPHAFTLFWMMLSLFTVLRLYRSRKINDYIKSGFTAGLAAGSLLTYGFVILALPIVQFTINVKDGFRKAAASVLSKNMWIALVACIAGFLLVNPFWLFSLKQVVMEFNAASIHWRFAPTPGNLFYHFRHVIMAGLGFPLWLTSIFGFFAAVAGRRKEVLLLVILFLTALIYFSFSTTRFMHYGLFMYPLLILLAAGFLERLIAGKKLMRIAGLTVLLAVFSYTLPILFHLMWRQAEKTPKPWRENGLMKIYRKELRWDCLMFLLRGGHRLLNSLSMK